jgi:PASTA domain
VDHRASVGAVGGSGSQPVTIPVTGLTPDTTYRYRVYGTSSNGTTVGKILTFHTKTARAVNQSPPTLSGTPVPGNDLTCGDGTWSDSPTFTVAWLRGGVVIGGQAAHTYTVQAGDVGSAIGCRVTAVNSGGDRSADSPTFVVAAVPPGAPQNVGAPSVSGQAKVGAPLACNAGSWTAGGTFGYAWLRDGVAIPFANGPGFVVRKTDAGHKLACRVTLTNKDGGASANSAAVSIPLPACIVPKLRGLTVKSAKSRLKAAHCGVGKIKKKKGSGVKVGRVLSSSPKAGAHKRNGTKVKLVVRK